MKLKLAIFMLFGGLVVLGHQAQADESRCDIVNDVYCAVDLKTSVMPIHVHNSSWPGRCGRNVLQRIRERGRFGVRALIRTPETWSAPGARRRGKSLRSERMTCWKPFSASPRRVWAGSPRSHPTGETRFV